MKLDILFTYLAIFVTFIFISIILYLPNMETVGFFILLIWYFCAHVFLFSQLKPLDGKWFLLIVAPIILLMSLNFIVLYLVKFTNAQDYSVVNYSTNVFERILENYKTIFMVCEVFILTLIANELFLQNTFPSLNPSPLFLLIISIMFVLFLILYYSIASKPDFQDFGNILAFKWAIGLSLGISFILWCFSYYNSIDDVYDILLGPIILSILCMSYYSLTIGHYLYKSHNLVV
jgi:hypothetical protein